jgi:hypothetical protein
MQCLSEFSHRGWTNLPTSAGHQQFNRLSHCQKRPSETFWNHSVTYYCWLCCWNWQQLVNLSETSPHCHCVQIILCRSQYNSVILQTLCWLLHMFSSKGVIIVNVLHVSPAYSTRSVIWRHSLLKFPCETFASESSEGSENLNRKREGEVRASFLEFWTCWDGAPAS